MIIIAVEEAAFLLAVTILASLPILFVSSASYRKRSRPTFLALRDRVDLPQRREIVQNPE